VGRASIAVADISIVAFFGIAIFVNAENDAIAAYGLAAASRARRHALTVEIAALERMVLLSLIALFVAFDDPVSAFGGFTILSRDSAVVALFDSAIARASVAVAGISIVAFFASRDDAISAFCSNAPSADDGAGPSFLDPL